MHDESCGDENACYSGYCISLVHELADMLDFTYEFVRVSIWLVSLWLSAVIPSGPTLIK